MLTRQSTTSQQLLSTRSDLLQLLHVLLQLARVSSQARRQQLDIAAILD